MGFLLHLTAGRRGSATISIRCSRTRSARQDVPDPPNCCWRWYSSGLSPFRQPRSSLVSLPGELRLWIRASSVLGAEEGGIAEQGGSRACTICASRSHVA